MSSLKKIISILFCTVSLWAAETVPATYIGFVDYSEDELFFYQQDKANDEVSIFRILPGKHSEALKKVNGYIKITGTTNTVNKKKLVSVTSFVEIEPSEEETSEDDNN